MPDSPHLQSFLVADIGSVTTKVGLVGNVSGEFRFVAAGSAITTATAPIADVTVGLRSAIRQIEARTESQLLTEDGQLISPERPGGVGVDGLSIVTSAPMPLRVAIVGLSREVSLASAVRAVEGAHATVEATLALDESGGRWLPLRTVPPAHSDKPASVVMQDPAVIAAEALSAAKADVIVLVGGIDGGAAAPLLDLANLVASIIAAREESARPVVIFAGNRDARPQIASRLGQVTQLRVIDNVRPTMEQENPAPLQRELQVLYSERQVNGLPGLSAVGSWTTAPIISSARAFENIVRFLGRRYDFNVLGTDLGGRSTALITARGEKLARVLYSDLGIGQNLERALGRIGIESFLAWLPMEITPEQARTAWLNQAMRPWTQPTTREEARLMQSAARAVLGNAANGVDMHGLNLVLLTGGVFAHNSNLGALALVALDALQPRGIFSLAVDGLGLAPAFGGLAGVNTAAAAGVIERDGFVTLGTVIAPVSKNRDGQIDLRIKVQPADGAGAMNYEVAHGSLELVPLTPGQKAFIEVKPARGVTLEQTRGGVFKAEIEGGALGLVIDARGRPMTLPPDAEKRRARVQQWYWDIGSEGNHA